MSIVEMGSVTSRFVNFISSGSNYARPLFVRDAPRFQTTKRAQATPIASQPLNNEETNELNSLRGLREALHSQ